jgi:hypothetical protein
MNGQRRPEAAPAQLAPKNIEPVGEPDTPLATAELLERVAGFVARYVVLPGESELVAIALFVLHTWAIDAAYATPYLVVVSPEPRAGKSLLLDVLERLVRCAWKTVSTTEAALFRKIDQDRPTLLLDEIDAIFGSNAERTEPLRAILNAGNRRRATATRVVRRSGDLEAREFNVFCPKVLTGIDTGRLPDTIRDRAIVVHMKRRHDGEPIGHFRERRADEEAEPIVEALRAWAERSTERLDDAEPALPHDLNDRSADAWEPLVAIADQAGGHWPQRAREAAIELSGDAGAEEASRGVQLLGAIQQAMRGREVIASAELLEKINQDEELPFGGWREGKGIDARTLAKLLKPFGVKPTSLRIDDQHTPKGYRATDLRDAWKRWLPSQEPQHAQQVQRATEPEVENNHQPAPVADVADVADVGGESLDADAELARLEDKGLCLDGEVAV